MGATASRSLVPASVIPAWTKSSSSIVTEEEDGNRETAPTAGKDDNDFRFIIKVDEHDRANNETDNEDMVTVLRLVELGRLPQPTTREGLIQNIESKSGMLGKIETISYQDKGGLKFFIDDTDVLMCAVKDYRDNGSAVLHVTTSLKQEQVKQERVKVEEDIAKAPALPSADPAPQTTPMQPVTPERISTPLAPLVPNPTPPQVTVSMATPAPCKRKKKHSSSTTNSSKKRKKATPASSSVPDMIRSEGATSITASPFTAAAAANNHLTTTDAGQTFFKKGSVHERIVLSLLELHELGITSPPRIQVGLFSGYANVKSKGFANAASQLSKADYISYPSPKTMSLTQKAIHEFQDSSIPPPRTTAAVHQRLSRILREKKGQQMFVLMANGETFTRDQVGTQLGYTNLKSKGFQNAVSTLSGYGLVEYPERGVSLRLTDICFPFGRPSEISKSATASATASSATTTSIDTKHTIAQQIAPKPNEGISFDI